jgi:hypothetical protein
LFQGVEVVDLSDDDDEGEVEGVTCFADSGLKRVIEALQTCPWNDFKGKFLSFNNSLVPEVLLLATYFSQLNHG